MSDKHILHCKLLAENDSPKCWTERHEGYPVRSVPTYRDWSIFDETYDPAYHLAGHVKENAKLDKKDPKRWAEDEDVDLRSVQEKKFWFGGRLVECKKVCYVDKDGHVLNPYGRTGIKGWGFYGQPGPNYCADPVISRMHPIHGLMVACLKRNEVNVETGEKSTQDALPGGMVENMEEDMIGSRVRAFVKTALREAGEEAIQDVSMPILMQKQDTAVIVYDGPVDDPRGTDWSFPVTVACSFHLTEDEAEKMHFRTDDGGGEVQANSVRWVAVSGMTKENTFASHLSIIRRAEKTILAKIEPAPKNKTFLIAAAAIVCLGIYSALRQA